MRAAVVLVLLFVSGCDACTGETVPFGLDAGNAAPHARAEPRDVREPERAPPMARTFPDGTRRIEVEGAPIEVDGSVRALWADDVDGDGDRDALLVITGTERVRLAFARRERASFEAPADLSSAPAPAECVVEQPALERLGGSWLVARATVTCAERPAASRRDVWIATTERTPRVLEHLAVLDAEGRAPGTVELALAAADRDEDGHDDLVVTVSVARESEQASIELPWLDRPSGLARDAAEPERTFATRAREALRALRRNPGRALSTSRAVVALHEVLCREPGRARLRVGESDGLGCGSSDGAGRAATTVVRALAQQGRLLDALVALDKLGEPGLVIDEDRRSAVREALARAPATPGVTLREGPTHTAPAGPAVRLSALAFLDEDRLLLRGERPRIFVLSSGTEMDADDAASAELRVLDPAGSFAVAGVERRCEGYVLRIVPASAFVMGHVLGATHSTPLLAAREPPAGAPCPDLTPSLRRDDGGFRVLGWAPQGVVAARGGQLAVVPLDLSARPAGAPELLGAGTLPPAPLPRGAITADGRFLVELRGLGVVVHTIGSPGGPRLLWPEGWATREGETISDPAVSPSGRRVAVLRGGRVLVLERTAR